jgi:hypothetical protein
MNTAPTAYGPEIKVVNGYGSVAVQRAYGGSVKPPTVWRGMVTIFFGGEPKFDIEVSLLDGREGRYIGWPSRSYDSGGQTKYKNMVWSHDRNLNAATVQCIEAFLQVGIVPQPPF